jgi:hypothetical protein
MGFEVAQRTVRDGRALAAREKTLRGGHMRRLVRVHRAAQTDGDE